ncbi:hypothetical protein VNO77_33218 [Canavalia gladiata]|uniref:Ribosomal RNA-processing protein 14 N-terminal domain-containing protein n=1 Tax=Canavalia gladiata TaxID=3824 RepID=A0AAN9PXI3_CANGL
MSNLRIHKTNMDGFVLPNRFINYLCYEVYPKNVFFFHIDKERPWFQGLSKVAKAEAKKETKENIKKSRRDRLDPDKPSAN